MNLIHVFFCSFLIELSSRIDQEVGGNLAYTLPRDVRGQTPSSMGESFFLVLYQARKYVLTSWYCNSFILSFFHSVPQGIIFINVPRHIPRTVHKCGRLALCYALCQFFLYIASNFKKRLHLPGVVRTLGRLWRGFAYATVLK